MADVRECIAGCGRPAKGDGYPVCEEHLAAWDADYWANQWTICGEDLLPPLVELAHQFGNEALEQLLRQGVDRAKLEAEHYKLESERLYSDI